MLDNSLLKWTQNSLIFDQFIIIVQSLSCVRLFATPWTAARQASLFFTISQSLLKLMFIEQLMPSNHLILCHPFLLLPSISYMTLKTNWSGFSAMGLRQKPVYKQIRWG